jgi:hypothetical protein
MGIFFSKICLDGERKTAKKTYEILDRTAFHLKRGDLLEAVVILNTLTGKLGLLFVCMVEEKGLCLILIV